MINSLGNSIPRNGLVGEWLLDGNALDTASTNNGTETNVTYVKTNKGYQSQAGSFNGISSIVSISNDLGIAGGNITMSAYVKLNAEISSGYYTIIKQNDLTSGVGFQMYYEYNGGTRRLAFQRVRVGVAGNLVYYNITLGTSNRYHLSLVNNTSDNTIKIYLNGVLVGSATSSNSNGNAVEADLTAIGSYGTSLYANAQIQLARIYNRALSQDEIQLLYLEGQRKLGPTSVASYPKLLDGLVGYWDFRGTRHNLVDGILATNTNVTNGINHLGQTSLNTYNGTDSKLSLPGSYINLGIGDFTASFWVTLNQGGTDNVFLSNLTSSSPTGFSLCRDLSNKISLEQWNTGAPTVFNTINNYATGTYFVTFQRASSGTLNIYINGVLENTGTGTVRNVTSTQVCDFGRYTYNNTKFMNGKIDECIIQNRILSADEVKALYDLTSQDYIYPSKVYDLPNLRDGLVLDLDSNGKDLSGNGNHLTLVNAPILVRQGKAKGLSYNGSNQHLINTSPTGLSRTNGQPITVNAWIKWNGGSGYQDIITIRGYYGHNWIFYRHGTGGELSFHGVDQNRGTYVIPQGVRIMTTATVDSGQTLKVYANGILNHTLSGYTYGSPFTNSLYIGAAGSEYIENFNGTIIQPRIWNRALSDKEIQQLYYSQKGSFIY